MTHADRDATRKALSKPAAFVLLTKGLALTNTTPASIPVVTLVEILPTQIWVEDDICGARHVMLQHRGHEAFCYASFHYGYGYTDNSSTWAAATALAVQLGATEPVERRCRPFAIPDYAAAQAEYASWFPIRPLHSAWTLEVSGDAALNAVASIDERANTIHVYVGRTQEAAHG